MNKWDDDRIKAIEAEVAKLRDQVDQLLAERRAGLEANAQSVRSQIGLPR